MAAIGTDSVTSLSRHYIMPEITDNIYGSNPVFFRLSKANKKMVQGGTQIEVPLMYARFNAGGPYRGFDLLNVSPSDTVRNAVFDWKQQHVPVTIDGLTLIKTDSPESIVNYLQFYFAQAEMEMAANLGVGLWSAGTDSKQITGLDAAIDDGTVAATYGGITRSGNDWWKSAYDGATSALTLASLNTLMGNASKGGKHSTLICSRRMQYNRYWALAQTDQVLNVSAGGHDEQLASAGFTNILFNNVPWVVDDNVPDGANTSNSKIFFLNEDFIHWIVSPRADFYLQPFQTPVNQDAMVSQMFWAGELVVNNCATQAKMSAVTS